MTQPVGGLPELQALSRRDLQDLAKQHSIKANQKTSVLVRLLVELSGQKEETPRKRAFAELDTNQDGVVDAAEFRKGLEAGVIAIPAAAGPEASQPSTLTAEQKERIARNREAAKQRRQASTAAKAASPAQPGCSHCGGDSQFGGLCIVWRHSGTIQRERGEPYSRWDRFRWTCCGRLDPQPCFVGAHNSMHAAAAPHLVLVRCHCQEVSPLHRTRKDGPNKGRYFFGCGVGRGGCKFFQWADKTYNVARPPACQTNTDGVDELALPYANPFGERLPAAVETEQKQRQRLVAAVIFRDLCVSVRQGRLSVFRRMLIERTVSKFAAFDIKEALYPITDRQACIRFGDWQVLPPNKPRTLSEAECGEVLDLLLQSKLVKSVVDTRNICSDVVQDVAIELQGLESYLSV